MILLAALSITQGFYYVVAGVWPLVSIGTFQRVTGPKTDLWLVRTVGVLVAVIGEVLILAGIRRRVAVEVPVLAASSAAGLAAIDVIYATTGRISRVYLADAAAELVLLGGWALAWLRAARGR
jgi:uncharacterized membrane protein